MKLALRILVLTVLFTTLNWFYKETLFRPYLEQEAEQYLQVQKIASCDVVYVSASSNFSPDPLHENPRKLSQFVADYYPSLQFEAINKPASHAGTYRDLLDIFPDDSEVKTVVVAMNLRSFGPSWINSELETALNQSAVMYNDRPPLLNRFLVGLNAYDQKTPEERDMIVQAQWQNTPLPFDPPHNTVSNWCAEEKWGDWRNPTRQLADQFIKQYAFVLNEHNPRVQDFDAIVEIAAQRGWNLMFSILAEDMQTADSLVGNDLCSLMRNNVEWLLDRYANRGVLVLNNLAELPNTCFADKDFPTEHYTETGRRKLASNIAFYLQRFHAEEYEPAPTESQQFKLKS